MKRNLVLIVEEDNEIRFHLEDLLRNENFPVLSAGNAKQGLRILETFPILPDFIILDAKEGMYFRETQLSNPSFSHIPVILISDNASDERIATALKADFIQKPILLKHLLSIIATLPN